jgi:signal transduction histidine kinase
MLDRNEKKILTLIKLGPFLVILFSIIVTLIMIQKNSINFEKELNQSKLESINYKKMLLKLEINRVYNFILNEKKQLETDIKKELKTRVYQAHAIANSIYVNNQNKTKKELTKLIKDALRDIRFYENRGYYFIDELSGKNILHPILPELEGKNLLNVKDKRGNYVFKEMASIIKEKKEAFTTWWWTKPNIKNKEFKKIGFAKYFEPFDWFIGTGEYVDDYEITLKNNILKKINQIRYGLDGYIFAYDYKGNTLSHINKNLLNINRFNLQDKKGNYLVQNIINIAKKGEGFIFYEGTIRPSTGKSANKISFIKGIKEWNWLIGTGAYTREIEDLVEKNRNILSNENKDKNIQIMLVSFFIFVFIFILSLFFAKTIEKKFLEYKNKVQNKQNKQNKLDELNNDLEQKVLKRTSDLNESNIKLKDTLDNLQKTKKDLIVSEKMAILGELVGSITHEINSPLGICITSTSHIQEMTKKIDNLYKKEEMSEDEFKIFLKDLFELTKIISINLDNTSKLVKSFKNVAVDQAIEEKREFFLKEYIEEILLSLKSKTKKTNIQISVECKEKLILNTYPNFIFQILTNFINNSLLHGFEKDEEETINIIIHDLDNEIELIYKDNGKGIPEELKENIFQQYFTTKKGKGGTGLGLYIIKRIVTEKLNGDIQINKKKTKGVEFLIKIPKTII